MRSALKLWTDYGFERGIEEVTAAQIAAEAGVSKPTFYLYFARKEDILHEMAHAAAVAFERETDATLAAFRSLEESLDVLHDRLAERIEETGRSAVARSLAEEKRRAILSIGDDPSRFGLSYLRVLEHAQFAHELDEGLDCGDLANVLEALTLDAIERWARGEADRLRPLLRQRATLVLRGFPAARPAR